MFITNAPVYFHNAYFRAKVALLAIDELNPERASEGPWWREYRDHGIVPPLQPSCNR